MKKILFIGLIGLFFSTVSCSQTSQMKAIEKTITAFSKAGDTNNSLELAKYLDDNYRIVMNRLFGSKEVSVMSKSLYLEKIETKEFGGDTRELIISNVVVNGSTASAKVVFKGKKATFVSLMTLIQNEDGTWKLISDVPIFS